MSNRGAKLIKIIRDLATEKPDFVYERPEIEGDTGCVYVHDRQPSCIVGHAMWRAGLIDYSYELTPYNKQAFGDHLPGMATLTDREAQWLEEVQGQQDSGETWANSILSADSREYDNE